MERAAFECVVVAQSGFVRDCLARLHVRTSDLADVEQEVWCEAWHRVRSKHRAPPQPPGKGIRRSLLRVCKGTAARYRRGRKRRKEAERAWLWRDPEQGAFPGPEEHLISRRDRQLVSDLLSRLEPERREVMVTYLSDGRAIGHVATKLGISVGTAYTRLRIAYADLRAAGRRLRVRAGEDVHLRVLEHKSTPERMKVEIVIGEPKVEIVIEEPTGHQGSP
jgi:RNA polymerase sigma factor (sigma-70 family)